MQHDPHAFAELFRRHEELVLRRFMARVRSPELAADLTAETFASALRAPFDPARESEAEWLERLAERQLAHAYRNGVVAQDARARLRMGTIVLDDRTLDRIWALRGPDRDVLPKPLASGEIVVRRRGGATLEDALRAAAARLQRRRRWRRRALVGARVAAAVISIGWLAGQAVAPDRSRSAETTTWLPFAQPGVEGYYPRTWFLAPAPQAPFGGRELVTITTYETGYGTDAECGALRTMSPGDGLVAVFGRGDRARIEARARRCAPTADVEWREDALIVLGPSARRQVRELPQRFLERIDRRPGE